MLNILGPVAGYEKIWFFMDEFGNKSFEKHFKSRQQEGYVNTHFDVSGFSSNSLNDNPSIICRFANLMNVAVLNNSSSSSTAVIKRIQPLPKLIVVVPDNNILEVLQATKVNYSKGLGMLINFIMTEHERGISSFKESLPAKSKKPEYPHILWILAPCHERFKDNDERLKFNMAVERMCLFHTNVSCLELKKVWDAKDLSLFDKGRFTAEGYKKYWEAVDRTVRYRDSVKLKKNSSKKQKFQACQNDRFKWKNPKISEDVKKYGAMRKLPSPPPKFNDYRGKRY